MTPIKADVRLGADGQRHVGPQCADRISNRAGAWQLMVTAKSGAPALGGAIAGLLALRIGIDWVLPAVAFVAVLGVVLSRIDVATRRLPFAITLPMFVATAVLLLPAAVVDGWPLVGWAAVSSGGWLTIYAAIAFATGGRGMGWGDVALAPTLGLVLGAVGAGPSIFGLVAGFVLAATLAVGLVVSGRADRQSAIPFGPFMLAGAAIGIVCGGELLAAVFGPSG